VALVSISLLSAIYRRFLYGILAPHYEYVLKEIIKTGDVVTLRLAPQKKSIVFQPGQFAFLSFHSPVIPVEQHPFTISSASGDELLEFNIKLTGDYTRLMAYLSPGDKATVFGPYGAFGDEYLKTTSDQIWVAGGIGITPFLPLVKTEAEKPTGRKVYLYYCVKTSEEGIFDSEIRSQLLKNPDLFYSMNCSVEKGRIDAKYILGNYQGDVRNVKIFLCGPRPMMEDLTKQFKLAGIEPEQIFYEDFAFQV
jgi:predicted ferric reductase